MEIKFTTNGLNSNVFDKLDAIRILLKHQTREDLRELARALNVERGQNTSDTLANLMKFFQFNCDNIDLVNLTLAASVSINKA